MRDADGKPCDPIKEEFQYDNWGRLISKKDSRNQVSTYRYDELGRIVAETLPPIDGKQAVNETYYNDSLNYITETDANHQKKNEFNTHRLDRFNRFVLLYPMNRLPAMSCFRISGIIHGASLQKQSHMMGSAQQRII